MVTQGTITPILFPDVEILLEKVFSGEILEEI
jgi:hypothetical protein